jgi:serine/threonine protein kinase
MLQTRVGDIKLVGLYASPEQVMGGKLDERSDLYSLGLTFFEMLTGRTLHLCKTIEQFMQIFQKPAPAPSQFDTSIPELVDSIALKLLATKPDDRYQAAKEILIELGTLRLTSSPQEKELLFGKEADLLFDKARVAYEQGEYRETGGRCQALEDADVHRKTSMYLLLARAAEAMDRPDISIRYLEKASFLKPDNFSVSMDYFCELVKRNDLARARELAARKYKSLLDKETTAALLQMLAHWEEPEYIEARRLPKQEPKSFFDKMKSLFG